MNIHIRRAEPGDYEAVHKIYTYPKAVWGTLQMPYPSLERWRKRLADPTRPRRQHVGQIGMAVRDDWHGKGVGSALMQAAIDLADRWLNLTRLELDVYTDNEPAVRLYQKFGFVIEGTRVQFAFRDGQFVDVYMMARLRRS